MSSLGRAGVVLLCLAGFMADAFTLSPAREFLERGQTDFMAFYAGGKLAFTDSLYDSARQFEAEARDEGLWSPARRFIKPPFIAVFLRPLTQLPYRTASMVWEALCAVGIFAFAVMWPARRRWRTALVCCWSLPLAMTLAEGQDIGFVLAAIALAGALCRRKQPLAAGLAASLCLAKFHLFLLIPVWICAGRHWRFARGLLAGSAVLAFISFAAAGRAWPLSYYRMLLEPAISPSREAMPNLHALLRGLPGASILETAGAALLASAVWVVSRRHGPERGLAAALLGSILTAPHAYMADGAFAIPAVLLLLKGALAPWMRATCLFLLTPVPWAMLMAGMGLPAEGGVGLLVLGAAWYSRASRTRGIPCASPSGRAGLAA